MERSLTQIAVLFLGGGYRRITRGLRLVSYIFLEKNCCLYRGAGHLDCVPVDERAPADVLCWVGGVGDDDPSLHYYNSR